MITERLEIGTPPGDSFGGISPEIYLKEWPQYILHLQDVYIGGGGAIYDSDFRLIPEANFTYVFWKNLHDEGRRPSSPSDLLDNIDEPPLRPSEVLELSPPINYVYGHFYYNIYVYGHLWDTFQDVHKINSLKLSPNTLITPKLTGHVTDLPLHFELLGYNSSSILPLDLPPESRRAYKVPHLYYPSCSAYPSLVSASGAARLRSSYFTLQKPACRQHKLYLRRPNDNRGVINDKEVSEYLAEKGFTILDGTEGINSHVSLFRNASLLVGAHGALFKNLIFCNQSTSVLEFFPHNRVNTCYEGSAKLLGLNYKSLEVRGTDSHEITIPLSTLKDL